MTRREEMALDLMALVSKETGDIVAARVRLNVINAFLTKWAKEDALTRVESALLKLVQVEAMRGMHAIFDSTMHPSSEELAERFQRSAEWAAAREKETEYGK
jgi:hypothetical protein